MQNIEVKGERGLIASIINIAIYDALSYQRPRPPNEQKYYTMYGRYPKLDDPDYVSTDNEYLSWEARKFLSTDNLMYCMLCELLDINPKYLLEKIHKKISRFDKTGDMSMRRDFKVFQSVSH